MSEAIQLTPQQIRAVIEWMRAEGDISVDILKRFYKHFMKEIQLEFEARISGGDLYLIQKRANR